MDKQDISKRVPEIEERSRNAKGTHVFLKRSFFLHFLFLMLKKNDVEKKRFIHSIILNIFNFKENKNPQLKEKKIVMKLRKRKIY